MSNDDPVDYSTVDGIAVVRMDDGKANVMSRPMLHGLSAAFTRAAAEGVVAVVTGRERVFSAGYDMSLFTQPLEEIAATLQAGGELIAQMLSHPYPIVAACNGHAIAQGAFVLMACDHRVGADIDAKIGLNEVAIGLTIPHYGVELARHQLAAPWFDHATVTGTLYDPAGARTAGFLHELVDVAALDDAARGRAVELSQLDMTAHAGTKQRSRRLVLEEIARLHTDEFTLPTA